jgi:hypothetical protein
VLSTVVNTARTNGLLRAPNPSRIGTSSGGDLLLIVRVDDAAIDAYPSLVAAG